MRTRKARLPDAPRLYELIAEYAREGILLPRSLAEICERIRDFTVVESRGRVIGGGALAFYGLDLVEIRSLAVERAAQHRGAGRRLVEALLAEARAQGAERICLFTHIPAFFARLGFVEVGHRSLPEKLFKDCLKCPRLHCCDETAMMFAGEATYAKALTFAKASVTASAGRPSHAALPTGRPARAETRTTALPILRSLPG